MLASIRDVHSQAAEQEKQQMFISINTFYLLLKRQPTKSQGKMFLGCYE
jgi:hypothetical protein